MGCDGMDKHLDFGLNGPLLRYTVAFVVLPRDGFSSLRIYSYLSKSLWPARFVWAEARTVQDGWSVLQTVKCLRIEAVILGSLGCAARQQPVRWLSSRAAVS